jgi:diguanylate cyclase
MTYDFTEHLKDLHLVLQEHTEWFMRLTRHIHYPNTSLAPKNYEEPNSFAVWLDRVKESEALEPETINGLVRLHDELCTQARKLMEEAQKFKQRPDFEDFDKLALYFEEFINRIRRLEKDCLMEGSGLDELTGLRNGEVMYKDLDEEMERVSRQGKPFVIALIKIDHFEDIQTQLNHEDLERMIIDAARLVKRCIRSFDDAYRIKGGVFLVSLKQTSIEGGVKALMRLKADAAQFSQEYKGQQGPVYLTLSSTVAEPVTADNMRDLIESLEFDLKKFDDRDSSILQYNETAPLMKFVSEISAAQKI